MEPKETHGPDCDCNRCAVVSMLVAEPEFFHAVKDGLKDVKGDSSLQRGVSIVESMLTDAETRLEESRK